VSCRALLHFVYGPCLLLQPPVALVVAVVAAVDVIIVVADALNCLAN